MTMPWLGCAAMPSASGTLPVSPGSAAAVASRSAPLASSYVTLTLTVTVDLTLNTFTVTLHYTLHSTTVTKVKKGT